MDAMTPYVAHIIKDAYDERHLATNPALGTLIDTAKSERVTATYDVMPVTAYERIDMILGDRGDL
jgi:hypothetical protein